MPIIRSLSTAVAASGLPLERGGSSVVVCVRSRHLVYWWNVVVAVLLVVVVLDGPLPTTLLPPRSNGKPEAATAVDKLLMMGMRMPETC